ncbi:S9 family peptidase [Robertkochia aurantiaca]|uniref:S9 family peptidase n=1 Tax=Robertkochia aurantiaca TaxID=2873700 RepID=UPI001CCFA440|nr:S9 family peptidase [Robertkochia sp. 3YJGBD-33]
MIKNTAIFIMAATLLGGCRSDKDNSVPEDAEVAKYSIEQFMDNENAWPNGYSPDLSTVLVTSNRSGIFNMYTVPAEGGELQPVTQSDSASVWGISYFPNDKRILFRMDDNGDEVYKLFVKDSSGIKRLTPAENVRTTFYGWSQDGDSFFYQSNERDSRYMDLYEMDAQTFESRLIYEVKDGFEAADLSPDKQFLSLVKPVNTNDTDLFILNLETGEQKQINESLSGNYSQDFGPEGEWFYYTTDEGAEFSYLMRYNLKTGEKEKVAEKDWDIMNFYFTHDGKYRVMMINEDAKNTLEVTDNKTGDQIAFPEFQNAYVANISFSRDESKALLSVGGSHTPTNAYSYSLENRELHKLTEVLNPEIEADDLVRSEVVRFRSFDSLEIPAIYYEPKQASVENKVPALVWVHGGPGGQSRQNFSAFIQYLVNHGYAVLAVNNRGSSGYGKTFYQMDDQNHGDKDLKDCIAGKDWLAQQDVINPDQIGIIGGSYGGYMTMAALTYAPDEFEAGVNLFGVTNWIRTLKSIPPWWESFKDALYKELGDPYSADSVRLREISPLFHTDKVKKPLIVLQGAKDPRVLQVESDEIVEGVRANGVPVEYVLFEDEGHGFAKKENQIKAYESILKFLNTHLKKESDDPDMTEQKDVSAN